jgi:hypothetical protein
MVFFLSSGPRTDVEDALNTGDELRLWLGLGEDVRHPI